MKLLLDTCVSGVARDELLRWVTMSYGPAIGRRIRATRKILSRAHGEKRILVTLDKDFGELAIVRRARHSGIV